MSLKTVRESKYITQKQLSEMCGVTQQAISYIENNECKRHSFDTMTKIAKALDCSVDDLIKEAKSCDG